MPIAKQVTSLDEVEEGLRGLYVEQDGEFTLRDDLGLYTKDTVDEFRTNNLELKREAERLQKRLESGEIDRERYNELLEAEEKRAQEAAEKKGEWEKIRSTMQEKHEAAIRERESHVEALEAEVRTLMIDNSAIALLQEDDTKGSWALLQAPIRNRTKVEVTESGQRRVRVLNEDGTPAFAADGTDQTLKGLVLELKQHQEFGKAFEGTGASGGGAPADTGGAGGSRVSSKADFKSMSDRMDYIDKHGHEAYADLPDQ